VLIVNGQLRRTGKKVSLEAHVANVVYQALTMGVSIYELGYSLAKLSEM